MREAGPSWTELEGPAAAGGVARVTRRGGVLGVVLQISNFDRNIARNKVQLEGNKVFKIKYGCKRIIDHGQMKTSRSALERLGSVTLAIDVDAHTSTSV